jgi:hypothetical protein
MYHTTGFTKGEIVDLCVMIHAAEPEPGINHWPPILGLFRSVVVALTYMRRNRAQEELAETYRVSQPTISRDYHSNTLAGQGAEGIRPDG